MLGLHDVVIVGGGLMGCATALHLLMADPGLDVVVVEADPTYERSASASASGGVRQLFTQRENILLSQYTLAVIGDWQNFAAVEGEAPPDLQWREQGYLFITGGAGVDPLQANFRTQQELGVNVEWLDPEAIRNRYPMMETGDLAAGVLSPSDGWLDPSSFLQGLRHKSQDLGADFIADRVTGLSTTASAVRSLDLQSGRRLRAELVVNTAGCWAAELAEQVGMTLPVEPMRRLEHFVETREDYSHLPFVKDPGGLAVRPEGGGLDVGLVDRSQRGGFDLEVDASYFESTVWPALAHRFPALDRLRLRSTWAGLYDENRLDGNMIVGNWPGHLDNFYVACGFSGHGLMHAPGIGRALSELMLKGGYETIDLDRFGYQRVVDQTPLPEVGIR